HLRVIAQRESGGNPNAVNPAGYYGLFQFSPSTWASVGGTGNPANASVEEQWKRARILYQTAGASQWSTAY
ncbi:MAG: transglycosylase family protein, partial [Macrococcoides caseolyticum]